MEMTKNQVNCKHCQSARVVRFGTYHGVQRYWCKDCKRKFKADDSLFRGKVSASDISTALNEYYSGMSINDIRRRIKQEKGYYPAQSTVYQWVDKFTDVAVRHYDRFKPNVGDVWVADETVLNIDGKDVWLWDVIDEDTRFLLASKLSYTRNISDAKTLFELAKRRAGKEPKVIITDKLKAYPEAARETLSDTHHKQSRPFTAEDSTNKIERWHSTLKERTKVMRGLKDTNSALAFTDGFLAYYNFIRPHEALDGRTPAEQAGVDYTIKNWAGIIRLNEPSQQVSIEPLEEARRVITGKPYKAGRRRSLALGQPTPRLETPMPAEVKRLLYGRPPRGIRL